MTDIPLSSEFPLTHAHTWFTHAIESCDFYSDQTKYFSRIPQINATAIEALVEKDGEQRKITFQRNFAWLPVFSYQSKNLEKILKTAWLYFVKNCQQQRIHLIKVEKIDLEVDFRKKGVFLARNYSYPHKTVTIRTTKAPFQFYSVILLIGIEIALMSLAGGLFYLATKSR